MADREGVDVAERTCEVDDCDAPRHGRRWCSKHYQRIKHHGHAGPLRSPKPDRCAVDGCASPHNKRQWCSKHYQHWLKTGDPLGGGASPHPGASCNVDGCERPHTARGYCGLHYKRWQSTGDPLKGGRAYQQFTARDKVCVGCGQTKPLNEFSPAPRNSSGRSSYCRPCQNERAKASYRRRTPEQTRLARERERRQKVKRTYGITDAEYDALNFESGCQVCGGLPGGRWKRRLHIDHDHATGQVRGLLCHGCNVTIGNVAESPIILRALADYLERWGDGAKWTSNQQAAGVTTSPRSAPARTG